MQGTELQGVERAAGAASVFAAARPQASASGTAPGFRVAEQGSAGAPAAPAAAAAPVALLGLLSVQEAEGDAMRDRAARKRGKELLDELARLQRTLLGGRLDPDALRRLAAVAAEPADAADPVLAATLRAIVVRARVELARYSLRHGGAAARR